MARNQKGCALLLKDQPKAQWATNQFADQNNHQWPQPYRRATLALAQPQPYPGATLALAQPQPYPGATLAQPQPYPSPTLGLP